MLDDDVSNPLGTALIPRLRIRVRASFLLLNRLPDGEGLRAQVGSDTGHSIASHISQRESDDSHPDAMTHEPLRDSTMKPHRAKAR